MSLVQYTISNNSSVGKTFLYYSASIAYNKFVSGFTSSIFLGDNTPTPTLLITGSMVSEDTFISDAYIPPSGSAWLWSNGNKVQYIKISNTPLTGSNISSTINQAKWVEFSMVEAKDKDGNYLYPTAPNSAIVERYIISNANDQGTYNSIIINDSSTETSVAVSANTTSTGTGFSYIDQQFSIDPDCDPLLNNAIEPRTNEWLQDVDYSVNAITPVNFDQLINFTATKAAVPQSNYTQLGFVNSRYAGSSTTRNQINEYDPLSIVDTENKSLYSDGPSSFFINKGKGAPLGKIPNVELNNAYIAYFNRIIDPYPLLNNRVAYYVKYLIDEGGNVLDPNVSNINFSIFEGTFQLRDYDNKPTRVNTSISNIEQGKELVKLTDGLHSVHTVGAYPVPILYTQTSSIGHVNSISLSGSSFYSALGLGKNFIKLGIDIYSTQSSATSPVSATSPTNLTLTELQWLPINITPFKSNTSPTTFPTSSTYPAYVILFPTNDSNSPQGAGAGNILSDNYTVEGSFTFTTSTMPAVYKGTARAYEEGYIKNYLDNDKNGDFTTKRFTFDLKPNVKLPTSGDNLVNYVNTSEGLNVKSVKLTITTNPGGTNEVVYSPLTIESGPLPVYGTQWQITPTGLRLTPDSLYLEKLIIENIYKGNVATKNLRLQAIPLIAGGWSGNPTVGYAGIPVKYDWTIEFEFTNVKQGTGLFFNCTGTMENQASTKPWGKPDDAFLFFESGGGANPNIQWRRTFTPTYATAISTKPILKYSVTSPLSENAVQNTANGPFWRRYPLTTDELYMSSSILNQTYGKSFVQAKLPYIGAVSTDFPLTVEPSFIEFDPITDYWELQEGDEIRFENNENLTYRITSIGGRKSVTPPNNPDSDIIADKLKVVVTPPFQYTGSNGQLIVNQPSDFDFFVVRRYKENKNFIILDQQMPYGIISTGKGEVAFSGEDGYVGVEPVNPSSSPGLLLPQHRVDKFNINPDLVLKDLIEKKII
jgi:hypothetical protein